MQLFIFAVRDSATGAYMRPFYMSSEGQALRTFQDEVNRNDKDNLIFSHPEDFELFMFGSFFDEIGVFELLKVPKSLGVAKALKIA